MKNKGLRQFINRRILLKATCLVVIGVFLSSPLLLNTEYRIQKSEDDLSALAIWDAVERGAAQDIRAKAYRELFDKKEAPVYGGKGAWDKRLEELAPRIGFKHPGSIRLTIQEAWQKFIEGNQGLIDEGNKLIEDEIGTEGAGIISAETQLKLQRIRNKLDFPKELRVYIREHTKDLKGWAIARSSGRREDSFLRSIAGVFISPRKTDERLIEQGVREIFDQAVATIWENQSARSKKIDGVPNIVTVEEGFGVVVQPFISFIASGTVKTDYYGHTSIECVFGDADMAVRGGYANTAQFLFKKGTQSYEYFPSFLTVPHQVRICSEEISAQDDPDRMHEVMGKYPDIGGHVSPVDYDQVLELYRVVSELETEIGVPLDIEWGYFAGELYIIQMRPVVGDYGERLVAPGDKIKKMKEEGREIAHTPTALGSTHVDGTGASEGFTGKMVLFGKEAGDHTVKNFEISIDKGPYIRVQYDVASRVLGGDTSAKVLVDPDQGSRQAHNVTLIESDIAGGRYSYCNSPVLKAGLLENIHFDPHPSFKGVWVSREDVTYFCDGLKGTFFKADDEGRSPVDAHDNKARDRSDALQRMLLREMYSQEKCDPMKLVDDVLRFFSLSGYDFLTEYAGKPDGMNVNMEGYIAEIESSEVSLESFLERLGLLRDVLEFPLMPSDWEMPLLKPLHNMTVFLEDYKRWNNSVSEDRPRVIFNTGFPGKLCILHLEDSLIEQVLIKNYLSREIDHDKYELFQVETVDEAKEILRREPGRFDLVMFDWSTPGSGIDEEFTEELLRIPFVALRSGITPEEFEEMADTRLVEHSETFIKAQDPIMELGSYVKRCIREKTDHCERLLYHPSGKMKILVVDDEPEVLESTMALLRIEFSSEEYEFVPARSIEEALGLIRSSSYDMVITDHSIPGFDGEYENAVAGSPYVVILSGKDEEEVKRELIPRLSAKAVCLSKLSADILGTVKRAARHREKMIEGLSGAGKFRVLFVEDEEKARGAAMGLFRSRFSSEEYEFIPAATAREAANLMDSSVFHLVISDFSLPGFEELLLERILRTPNAIIISGYNEDNYESRVSPALIDHAEFVGKPFEGDRIYSLIKGYRRAYQGSETDTGSPEDNAYQAPEGRKETVFVIDDSSEHALELADHIKDNTGDRYEIVHMDSTWALKRKLRRYTPDIVVTDAVIEGKEELGNIMGLVRGINPRARFIVMDEDASLRSNVDGHRDAQIRWMEDSRRLDISDIKRVKERGWEALSEKARYVLLHPDEARWGVNFDPKIYYEIYNFLNPLDPSEQSLMFLEEHEGLFQHSGGTVSAQLRSLIRRAIQASIFCSLGFDETETNELKSRIIMVDDTPEILGKKVEELMKPNFGFLPGEDMSIFRRYVHENYRMYSECVEWMWSRLDPGDATYLGQGDENDFHESVPDVVLSLYARSEGKLSIAQRASMSLAEGRFIRGDIPGALNAYKQVLLESLDREDPLLNELISAYSEKSGVNMLAFFNFLPGEINEIYAKVPASKFDKKIIREIRSFIVDMREKGIDEAVRLSEGLGLRDLKDIFEGHNKRASVMAVIEKPFHFNDIVEVLNGEYDGKMRFAEELYGVEESGRIMDGKRTPDDAHVPMTIKIWAGYAAPQMQGDLMQRMSRYSQEGPYHIEFEPDVEALHKFACDNGAREDIVTIMPFDGLNARGVQMLRDSNARVLFMDYEKGFNMGIDDFSQLSAIIFTGISYLNEDNEAFMKLYRLLTYDDERISIPLERIKHRPELFRFVLKKPTSHDYAELKKLNRVLERVMMAA